MLIETIQQGVALVCTGTAGADPRIAGPKRARRLVIVPIPQESAVEDKVASNRGGTTRAISLEAELRPSDLGDFAPDLAFPFALAAARFLMNASTASCSSGFGFRCWYGRAASVLLHLPVA